MSENSAKQSTARCSPACEGKSLIIEVMGKEHPEGHSFRIYEETDSDLQEGLESRMVKEDLEESVLHIWPWQSQPNRNIWLEIAAEEGDPIRVPFLQDATGIDREEERQHHVILPVIPTTLISGVTLKGRNPAHYVMSRPGFIYLFHEGKLWRELEVRMDDKGVTRYHDVALDDYRETNGDIKPGYRAVTGAGLAEIWLPARVDGKWINIQAAFSESQWPGARVNYLQRKPFVRMDRCNTISMVLAEPTHDEGDTVTVSRRARNAFLASCLAPQRSRNPLVESQFDRPEKYLLDLTGEYTALSEQAAIQVHQRQEDPDPEDPIYEDERPEMTVLAKCLHRTLREVEAVGDETTEAEDRGVFDWPEETQSAEDVVKDARDRVIGAIRIDDPVGRLRYLQQRRQVAAWFSNAAVRRAKARPYFESALLVNSAIVPSNFGGKINPLNKYMRELNGAGRKELERSIAVSERKLAVQYGSNLQEDLLDLLQRSWVQHSLVDLFTHDGYDYAGAFYFLSSLIQEAIKDPEECDVLAARVDARKSGIGKEWLQNLCRAGRSNLLYSLLFPDFDANDLERSYEPQAQPDENSGDGQFRASELASLENTDLPELDVVMTRDGLELAAAAEAGAFATAFASSLRTGTQTLLSIHGSLWGAVQSASQSLVSHNQQLKDVDTQLKAAESELNRLSQERVEAEKEIKDARVQAVDEQIEQNQRTEQARQQAQARLNRIAIQESEIDRRAQTLFTQRQRLFSHAIEAQMKLYGGCFQQLRASLPLLTGKVRLERLSNAAQKGYFVIGISGLEDSGGEGRAVRMFGDITEQSEGGVRATASTSRTRAKTQGIPSSVADDALVLVVPENEQITKILKHLNTAERQYAKALKELSIWERYAAQASDLSAAATAAVARRVAGAEARLEKALSNLEKVDGSLEAANDAFDDIETNKAALDAEVRSLDDTVRKVEDRRLYRVLNSPLLPAAVMLMELHNVSSVAASVKRDWRSKGEITAVSGGLSAAFDVGIATVTLIERFLQNVALVERISRQLLSREWTGPFALKLGQRLGGPITWSKVFGAVGGILMTAYYALDANYLFRMGNTGAAVGALVVAAGGVALTFASLAGSAGLLFLGPAGWLALGVVLAISGTAMMAWFNEEPLEIWMRHGPFGSMDEKPFLKEPRESYYRLVSMLMGVRVLIEPNPLRDKIVRGELNEKDEVRLAALREANTRLKVESAIPGLFNDAELVDVKPYLQLVETKSERGYLLGMSDMSNTKITPIAETELKDYVLREEPFDGGTYVYLKTPLTRSTESQRWLGAVDMSETVAYHWNVRIQLQIRIKEDEEAMVFPAPDPEDPLEYSKTNREHTQPDFRKKGRPFWYDERVQYNG